MKIDTKEVVTSKSIYTPMRGDEITEPGVYVQPGDLTVQGTPRCEVTRLIVVGEGSMQAKIVKIGNGIELAEGVLDFKWVRVPGLALTITFTNDK